MIRVHLIENASSLSLVVDEPQCVEQASELLPVDVARFINIEYLEGLFEDLNLLRRKLLLLSFVFLLGGPGLPIGDGLLALELVLRGRTEEFGRNLGELQLVDF